MSETASSNTTGSVQVRLAERPDADAIVAVINIAFRRAEEFFVAGDRIDQDHVLSLLSSGKFLVADTDGGVTGCVYVEPRGDRAYLGLLSVDPARQQAGLGTLLMAAGEEYCRARGCRFIDIVVVNLREELPGFYHRRGYVETGTSPFPSDVKTKLPCFFLKMSKSLDEDERTGTTRLEGASKL
jgi:GNAT superfamily N-acetyltransferase